MHHLFAEITWDVVQQAGQLLKVSSKMVDKHCVSLERVGESQKICVLLRTSMARTKELREQHAADPRLAEINKAIEWKLQPNKQAGGTFLMKLVSPAVLA